MANFYENRRFIENEFEMAFFDKQTGLDTEELIKYLKNVQSQETNKPRRIVCAETYAFLLDNVQLEINEHTPFSVKLNIGVDYSRFASIDIFDREVFQQQRVTFLRKNFPVEFEKMLNDKVSFGTYTDFWHTVPNWNNILKYGFSGILEKAESSKNALVASNAENDRIVFLDSVIICYNAVLRLMERIYNYSLGFDVPEFSKAIKKLAAEPPSTLYEVMLLSVLYLYFEEIGCERGRTLGDIDRLYLPYYKNDLANGVSEETLNELFRYFFLHFTATKRFAQQPFCIGGMDVSGADRSNELTAKILDIYDELDIYDPKIHLRCHKNLDKKILTKAVSMIRRGHSSICLINDEAVFRGYEKIGIPKEDAQNYVLLGCYEPIVMGLEHGEIGAAWLNMARVVELTVNDENVISSGICDFDGFFDAFSKCLGGHIDFTVDFAQKQGKYAKEINPSPMYSSTFDECLEKGMDVHEYPLKYNNMGIKLFGMATVIDSLAAIKKYVYDKKEITLEELSIALKNNWCGYEELRRKILNDEDKYGNNRALPDDILLKLTDFLDKNYCGKTLERGGFLRLGLDSIDICVIMGHTTGATPDGRKAGENVSKNLCACEGKDKNGITAYLQTLLKIDSAVFLNAAPCDFILHPSAVEGEKGLRDFVSLVEIYFTAGGLALQGNIFNIEMLKEAQKNPEKYSTLQVRVCGWNEYFVKLDKEKQDMFIRQCEVSGK